MKRFFGNKRSNKSPAISTSTFNKLVSIPNDDTDQNRLSIDETSADLNSSLQFIQKSETTSDINDLKSVDFQQPILSTELDVQRYILLDKVLEIVKQPGSNFYNESQNLAKYTNNIKIRTDSGPLFLAPNVPYSITNVGSVKLVVYEDRT